MKAVNKGQLKEGIKGKTALVTKHFNTMCHSSKTEVPTMKQVLINACKSKRNHGKIYF